MSPQERNKLKNKLEILIKKTDQEIFDLEKLTKPIVPENSLGRISRMDAINNKSVVESALRTKKKKVGQMRIALTKVDDPNFGNCSHCKKPINPARLILMPESIRCVRCAQR